MLQFFAGRGETEMTDNIIVFGIRLNAMVFVIELFVHAMVLLWVLVFMGTVIEKQILLDIIGLAFIISVLLKGRELKNKFLQERTSR